MTVAVLLWRILSFLGSRRPMWFTHSKRTFMGRFSVWSWWATSVQREATTHLVRHLSFFLPFLYACTQRFKISCASRFDLKIFSFLSTMIPLFLYTNSYSVYTSLSDFCLACLHPFLISVSQQKHWLQP